MYDGFMMECRDKKTIEERIKGALLGEVYVTPKPGLVDLHDCGAHSDMDVSTFQRSADAITPYLLKMYHAGISFAEKAERDFFPELFSHVREIGKDAEKAMFHATNNVNTHKGIIFSMGLLLTAMGVDAAEKQRESKGERAWDIATLPYEERICFLAGRIPGSVLKQELNAMSATDRPSADGSTNAPTHGEQVFAAYGAEGVRGEAIASFPCLREIALPRYRSMSDAGLSENDRALDTLLAIMSKLTDTNILSRGGSDALNFVQSRAARILSSLTPGSTSWRQEIEAFNQECIKKNVSPGGAADILALTLLLTQPLT